MTVFTPTALASGITLTAGEPLEIAMADLPSSGFRWVHEIIGTSVEFVHFTQVEGAKDYGAPSLRRFNFAACAPGMTMIAFSKLRPWEADSQPVARHIIMINVVERQSDAEA